ncbi:MAG: ABC transporter permease [Bacteroidaceae bacterium]|nr:ABC transporter permease [Bacteroidaceae bacterium]
MKSYLTFLRRNWLYTLIEMFGLSVALGFVVLLASYARTEFSVGRRQPLSKQLYAVGTGSFLGMTLGTAEAFYGSIPEITGWTRIARYNGIGYDITVGGDFYETRAATIDTNFFQYFDYALEGCDRRRVLASPDEVILSRSFARKVFGTDDPVGKTIESAVDGRLVVAGVVDDFGPADVFQPFDIFLGMDKALLQEMDNFGMVQTFVTLADGTDTESLNSKLLATYMDYWKDWYKADGSDGSFLWGSSLTRLDEIYFSSFDDGGDNVVRKGDKRTVHVLLVVALVLLVSAVFNYINLTVAQTGKRAKEMATRRLLGQQQSGIVLRYLGESLFFTTLCFVIGIVLAVAAKPLFERLFTSSEIVLKPDFRVTAVAVALLAVVALVSGLLPAAFIARFQPIHVVKGEFRFRSKLVFSRVFIVLQNVISTVLVAVSLTMALQMHHLATLPTGYRTDGILSVSAASIGYTYDKQSILRERLLALPQVEAVGLAAQVPMRTGFDGVHVEGEKQSWVRPSHLDSTAFHMLGLEVVERYSEPLPGMFWVTEETRDRYGITPGHPWFGTMDGQPEREVCGVIRDFRSGTPMESPMDDSHSVVKVLDTRLWVYNHLVQVKGDRREAIEAVRRVCREVNEELTGLPKEMEVTYVDDYLRDSLTGSRRAITLVLVFMGIALVISALGLLAMSIYYTGQQARQIALRKVFGAEVGAASWQLARGFVVMAAVAVVVAMPLAVWAMTFYLEGFYNRIATPWWVVPVAALFTFVVAFVSVISQILHIALENPVKTLKTE